MPFIISGKTLKELVVKPVVIKEAEVKKYVLNLNTEYDKVSEVLIRRNKPIQKLLDKLNLWPDIVINSDAPLGELVIGDDNVFVDTYANLKIGFETNYKFTKDYLRYYTNPIQNCIQVIYDKKVPENIWISKSTELITKTQRVSFEQYVTRFTNAKTFLKDDEVRDMARIIRCGLMTYELVICETPEDYIDMFNVPTGSCMYRPHGTVGTFGYSSSLWNVARDEYKIHPGSWYHWTKTSKGVYLRNIITKKPVVRAMVYKDKDGNWTEYGDIHYSAGGNENNMMKAMSNLGFIHAWKYNDKWKLKEEFRAPGFLLDGVYRCPYPFGDYVDWTFSVSYDEAAQEFVFSPSKATAPYRYTYGGFIPETAVPHINVVAKKRAA